MTDPYAEEWRKERDAFHMLMGYCVAAWAEVDDELFRIFCDCLGPRDQSAVVYYRTPGLDIRLGLTDELVRVTMLPSWERPGKRDPRIKAWEAAMKGFRELLSVRRRIAHHPVHSTPFQFGVHGWGERLIAQEIHVGRNERLRDNAAKLKPLRAIDLRRHRTDVAALAIRLHSFYRDVLTKPPSEFHAPAPPPRSRDLQQKDRPAKRQRRRKASLP